MNERVFHAKRRLRDAIALLTTGPSDEAINRAIDATAGAQAALASELGARSARRAARHREQVVRDGAAMTDSWGRRRSPATLPGYHKGRAPRNKGQRYPASPPSTEEVAAMLRCCDRDTPHGLRLFSWVLLVWRTGLRIAESLALTEADLNPAESTVFVRCGKGGKQRLVGTDDWLWRDLAPWLEYRRTLPVGALFCVISGVTAGRAWSASDVRKRLPELAAAAGIRHRVAPHQLRHAHALGLLQEEINPAFISRQLGHENLAITTTYFQGLPQSDVIEAVRRRRVGSWPAMPEHRSPLQDESGSGQMRLYEADECGADGYPPQWHATIKHAVREVAGNRCVRCLHPYAKGAGEWSPCDKECLHGGPVRVDGREVDFAEGLLVGLVREARWRILTVHHLDGNKANCRWWNLAALCQRCHLQIQGKVRMERVWPWEHSGWFQPYVAGYYAWTYLAEELDRHAVEARLDELLSLERQVA